LRCFSILLKREDLPTFGLPIMAILGRFVLCSM